MNKIIFLLGLLILLLWCGGVLGLAVSFGQGLSGPLGVSIGPSQEARDAAARERVRVEVAATATAVAQAAQHRAHELETEADQRAWRFAAPTALGIILLSLLAYGGVWSVRAFIIKRATTIYPDKAGTFPIVRVVAGQATALHDPNRAPAPTTIYLPNPANGGITVTHIGADVNAAQLQVTTQAQIGQALRAVTSGENPKAGELAATILPRLAVMPIPEPEVLEIEPSHIERLLLEDSNA